VTEIGSSYDLRAKRYHPPERLFVEIRRVGHEIDAKPCIAQAFEIIFDVIVHHPVPVIVAEDGAAAGTAARISPNDVFSNILIAPNAAKHGAMDRVVPAKYPAAPYPPSPPETIQEHGLLVFNSVRLQPGRPAVCPSPLPFPAWVPLQDIRLSYPALPLVILATAGRNLCISAAIRAIGFDEVQTGT
jgi:hypothetical protein